MNKERGLKSVHLILTAFMDAFIVHLSFYLAFRARFTKIPLPNYNDYVSLTPYIMVLTILIFKIYGLYDIEVKTFTEIIFSTLLSVVMIMILTMALTFLNRGFSFPRSVFVIGAVIQFAFISLHRYICLYVIRRLHGNQKVLLIGAKDEACEVAEKFLKIPEGWFEAKYIVEEDNLEAIYKAIPLVDIVCVCPGASQELKSKMAVQAIENKKKILLVPEIYELLLAKPKIIQIDDMPVYELTDIALSVEENFLKRAVDLILSLLGLIIAFPVMLLIALLIKLTSPGPVFYIQKRVGRMGKPFMLYKFRTMINNAEKETGPVIATEKDDRITPIGKVLRATRLDELPQLINVLKGEMSFVGPRPERPFFVRKFEHNNSHYSYRHIVKPGITGLAQVFGKYCTDAEDKLRYDIMYIRNYSLLLDLRIILWTIKVVFMSESSKGREKDKDRSILSGVEFLTQNYMASARDK